MNETAKNLEALWIALDKTKKFVNPEILKKPSGYECTTSSPNKTFYLGNTAGEAVRKIREIHCYKNLPI